MKKLTLQDLTKEELLKLIESECFFSIKDRDIWWVRWESLSASARKKREEALALGWTRENFFKTEKIWRESERIEKQAEKLYEQREAYQ